MSSATVFNATASDFSAEVRAAASAFAKDPSDLGPFVDIEKELQKRRKDLATSIIASTSAPSAASDLNGLMKRMSDAMDKAANVPPLEAAEKMVSFMDMMQKELQGVSSQLRDSRAGIIVSRDGNSAIEADYTEFANAVQKLPAQYAGNPKACGEKIGDMGLDTQKTASDLSAQGKRIQSMLEAADAQLAKVVAMQKDTEARKLKLTEAVKATEEIKDAIDSCSTGTRAPVTVRSRPLSLRHTAMTT